MTLSPLPGNVKRGWCSSCQRWGPVEDEVRQTLISIGWARPDLRELCTRAFQNDEEARAILADTAEELGLDAVVLRHKKVYVDAGDHILSVARWLVERAPAYCEFNGVRLVVHPGETPQQVIDHYYSLFGSLDP